LVALHFVGCQGNGKCGEKAQDRHRHDQFDQSHAALAGLRRCALCTPGHLIPYCTATETEPSATGTFCDWEFFKPISVTVTEPRPGATATKFRTATGPEPETPAPAVRVTLMVASPASLRTSLIELTAPPSRESK